VTKARAPDGVKATLPLRHLEGWMFRPGMQLEVGWARGSLAVEGATETQSRPRSPQWRWKRTTARRLPRSVRLALRL